MEMTRTAAVILAAACVTTGAAGGYLAMRDTPSRVVASADLPPGTVPFEGVEQSEVAVQPEAPEVPEPATWGMMLMGFGGVAMMIRRRK